MDADVSQVVVRYLARLSAADRRRLAEAYFGKGWGQGGIPSGLVTPATPDVGAIQQQIRGVAQQSQAQSSQQLVQGLAQALEKVRLQVQLDQSQDIKVYMDGEDITSRVQVDVYSRLIRKALGG